MSNRSRVGRALFWAVASLLCLPALALAAPPQYIPGQIIVKFKATARTADRVNLRASVGGSRLKDLQIINGELVKVQGMTVEQAVALAKTNRNVEYAEPDWEIKLDAQPRRKERIDLVPNDTNFNQLYAMENTGQTGGTPGADISATNAWDLFTGSSNVLVGVIDTGIDYTHPDIAGNAWTNPGEIPGNSIDDDMNGFVDDVHGYDFVNNDGDPFDDNDHGTHCSGTIGGVGNNGLGVVGVNWDVSIAGIKFLSAGGSGSTANAILSVQYAITIGCDLTSNSWGGGGFSQALLDAINAAGAAGQLFVAAAGNSGVNMDVSPSYPASYNSPYIIAVAATDHNDALASFSNFGLTTCDLGAPGVDILSSIPGGGYAPFDGTSMACPHVAGAAALVKGRFPGMTNDLIKQRIMNFADPIPSLAGRCVTGARLNVFMAIADPDSINPGSIDDLAGSISGSSHVALTWTATGDDGETGRCSVYEIRYATFPLDSGNFGTGTLITPSPNPQVAGSAESKEVGGLAFNTTYYFAIIAKDEFGNPGGLSNVALATTLDAPDIAASSSSMSASLLTGATDTQTLTITNEGPGTLDWTVPSPELDFLRFAPPAVTQKVFAPMQLGKNEIDPRVGDPVIAASGGPDAFGYRWIDSDETGGPAFAWVDITGVGTPINFTGDDQNLGPFPIGFDFDFYGNTFNSVRVCSNGWLSFTSTLTQYSNQPLPAAGTTNPENLVAPFWDDLIFTMSGDAYYYNDGSRFIVSWVNVPHYNNVGGPYTFQAILYPTGEVRYQYLSIASPDNSATVGIQDAARAVGLQTAFNQTYVHNSLAVRYIPLAQWLSVTPTSGRLGAGASANLDVTFDAAGMTGGTYTGTIHVVSNDPDENPKDVDATLIVTGAPNIVASASLDYGTVFLGQSPTSNIQVSNTGTDVLNVTSIVCSDGTLSANPSNFVLAPSAAQDVVVTYAPASEAPLAATVTVNSDDPDQASVVFNATGNALVGPELSVQPTSLAAYMQPSETHQTTLRIANGNLLGQASLDYTAGASVGKASALGTIPSHPHLDLGKNEIDPRHGDPQIAAQGGPDAFGYRWKDSNEPGGPVFNWVDITGVGTPIPFTGDDQNLGPFPIGFNFSFYGNTYSSVRVCSNGWLSFTSTATSYANTALPAATPNPENLVAPLWDDLIFSVSGDAYYYNDGSRFIVSWVNVPHYTTAGEPPGPFTFQAILYPSGKIVYQYLDINPPLASQTVGIQNQARTIGLQTVFNAAYLADNMAVQIQKTPEWLSVSPPAGSIAGAGTLDLTVTFNSTDLVPGTYLGNIHVTSNDPDEASQDVPVTLVVGGTTDVAAPREFALAMVGSNPTRSTAQFTVAMPAKGDVDVRVYDARGSLVRGLAHGARDAGFHPITWNGMDDRGRTVASGVYYVRMRAAGTPDKTVRVTLLH